MTTVDHILDEARERGFLGPSPITDHRASAASFAAAVPDPPARALDLGTGGGVPALLLAELWPDTVFVLVEADRRRAGFLEDAVLRLSWSERMVVVCARAETAGHDPDLRASFDVATARCFGRPAVVAECGAPFLQVGGALVVSDPPSDASSRWPATPLAKLGLEATNAGPVTVLRQRALCPDTYARRAGVPRKRPLF